MSYKSFAEHEQTYKINGRYYAARVNFLKEILWIKDAQGCLYMELPLSEYENFEGDMEEYVTSKIKSK